MLFYVALLIAIANAQCSSTSSHLFATGNSGTDQEGRCLDMDLGSGAVCEGVCDLFNGQTSYQQTDYSLYGPGSCDTTTYPTNCQEETQTSNSCTFTITGFATGSDKCGAAELMI